MTPTRNTTVTASLPMPPRTLAAALRSRTASPVKREISVPRRMGMKIGEIGAHQPGEERDLHIGDDPLSDPGHQHRFCRNRRAL